MTKEKAFELSGNLKSNGATLTRAQSRLGHGQARVRFEVAEKSSTIVAFFSRR
jgi:hypothetical protein